MIIISVNTFFEWLDNELNQRGWARVELTKRADISESGLSMAYSGKRQVGPKMIKAIAHALNIPEETVYRAAGILPPEPADTPPTLGEWMKMFIDSDEGTRDELLAQARFMVERKTNPIKKR